MENIKRTDKLITFNFAYLVAFNAGITGRVRLSRGLIPQQGYVEICNNGLWSRPCSSSWDVKDTAVVCRQLRFPITKASK